VVWSEVGLDNARSFVTSAFCATSAYKGGAAPPHLLNLGRGACRIFLALVVIDGHVEAALASARDAAPSARDQRNLFRVTDP
jgi:hypothetical protein